MEKVTVPQNRLKSLLGAILQTFKAPQWSLLLLVVFLGLTTNADAGWLVLLLGLLISVVLCLWALAALGYDGGNLRAVLFGFQGTTLKQSGVAALLLGLTLGLLYVTSRIGNFAEWLLSKLSPTLAPAPDTSLAVVFLSCVAFTIFSTCSLWARKRTLRQIERNPLSLGNRKWRREQNVSTGDYEDFKARRVEALQRHDYWLEASLVLGLAAVAVVPGALGWEWLWGVTLSIVLPMFVLSVRFRRRLESQSVHR